MVNLFKICFQEQIKFLEEEIRSMDESELAFSAYKDWFGATLRKFRNMVTKSDAVDKVAMEKKIQKFEVSHEGGLSVFVTVCPCHIMGIFQCPDFDFIFFAEN